MQSLIVTLRINSVSCYSARYNRLIRTNVNIHIGVFMHTGPKGTDPHLYESPLVRCVWVVRHGCLC